MNDSFTQNFARLQREIKAAADLKGSTVPKAKLDDYDEIANVIRMTNSPASLRNPSPTDFVLYAQNERRKAVHCERAIRRIRYGGRFMMVKRALAIFSGVSIGKDDDAFSDEETGMVVDALELLAAGHIRLAEEAEAMVDVKKPAIEMSKEDGK